MAPLLHIDLIETDEMNMRHLVAVMPIVLYLAALCLRVLGVQQPFGSKSLSPTLQWTLTLALGVPSLWAAVGHGLDSDRVAKSIGWLPSSFQKEIAGANLVLGLGAIVASDGGRWAAWAIFFMAAAFLWSAAAVHIADMREQWNLAMNSAGPIFWCDIVTPSRSSFFCCLDNDHGHDCNSACC